MRSPQTHTHAHTQTLSHSPTPILSIPHSPKLPLTRCPTHTHTRSSHEAAKDLVRSQVRREEGEQELMFFNLEMRSELKYTKLIKIPISKKERVREKKCQRKEKTIQNSLCLFDAVFDHAAFVTTQARHAPSANNTNAVACANISRGEERARRLRQRLRQRERRASHAGPTTTRTTITVTEAITLSARMQTCQTGTERGTGTGFYVYALA